MPSCAFQHNLFQPTVFQNAPMLGVFQPGPFQPGVFQAIPTQGRTAPSLPKGVIQFHQPQEDDDGVAAVLAALVTRW